MSGDSLRHAVVRAPGDFDRFFRIQYCLYGRCVQRKNRELDTVSIHARETFVSHFQNLTREFIPFSGASGKAARILERFLDRHMFFECDFSNHGYT